MKPVIAVPYFPGSNGDHDAISRIEEFGMKAVPLYFHIGDETRLEKNANVLAHAVDGAVLPGGFPYEDRLGFGVVPAKIKPFASALRTLADKGKPVIAFCSGDQIAQTMRLAFPLGSDHKVAMLPNICDKGGRPVYHGFLDKELYTQLECSPERTAFTRNYKAGEVIPSIIDHGGGRFWANKATLGYLLANGLVVARYCDKDGNVVDDFPVNPNGSMLNIESITNKRGNVKIGMCHNERKLNALYQDRANLVFASMKEFIEEGCPDLSSKAKPQDIPINLKDFSYLSQPLDLSRTIDIYVKMLTDDNERMTAQLFLGGVDIERRRLLRIELSREYVATTDTVKKVAAEIAKMDFFAGIMLKKDLPSAKAVGTSVLTYEVIGKEGGRLIRDFTQREPIVDGFPVMYEQIGLPNPEGYFVREKLWKNEFLKGAISNVRTGMVWFFRDHGSKQKALTELLE